MGKASRINPTIGGYQIVRRLGRGGMGQVFLANQVSMDRLVALKVLSSRWAAHAKYVERFHREGRTAGKVVHPHVVVVHEVGRAGRRHYMAMEYMAGGTVADLLSRHHGKLPLALALPIIRDALLGLQAIGDAGLLHRDIKPGNILLDIHGRSKLADFGLAQVWGEGQLDADEEIVGTPAYMSPESIRGDRTLDIRTDTYAIGATAYRMLSGRRPYAGPTPRAVAKAVLAGPPPDPRLGAPDLPIGMVGVIRTAMARDLRLRYPSPEMLLLDCDAVARDAIPPYAEGVAGDLDPAERWLIPPQPMAPSASEGSGPIRLPIPVVIPELTPRVRRRMSVWVSQVLALLAMAGTAIIAWLVLKSGSVP